MKKYSINLGEYRTPGARIFTGRDRGIEVRVKSKIDNFAIENDTLTIIIPEDIITINPSFLEEYFKNVIMTLGKEDFLKKFKFENQGEYKIEPNLNTAIDRILRKYSALKR